MTQSSKNFKGGLILNKKAVELGLTGFGPVLYMLLSGSARIQALTVDSLSGFMITLNVVQDDSTYQNFKNNKLEHITSFIIKIVVIRDKKQPLPKFKGIPKSSETESSFLTEARLQQTIWLRNAIGGKPEFTPSVANFALFEEAQSLNVLKCLGAKGDPDTIDVIHYLSRINSLKLGVLLMPMIDDSVTLRSYLSNSDEEKKIAYCHTIANIVKLFILINVVHWDLHSENAMIVSDTQQSFLIDFGRASNIKQPNNYGDHIPDSYIDVETKRELYDYAEKCKISFFDMIGPVQRERKRNYTDSQKEQDDLQKEQEKDKSAFMEVVCKSLTELDRFINGERIKGEYEEKGYYQMNWMEEIYSRRDKDEIFLCAYEKLKRDYLTHSISTTDKTIKKYIKDGKLFDLLGEPDSYYYEFPPAKLQELQIVAAAAPSVVQSVEVAPPPAQRGVFNSSIFLEDHATPHSYLYSYEPPPATQTPHVIISHALSTLKNSLKSYTATDEDYDPPEKPTFKGGKTKKKNNKKRKTRKISSGKSKRSRRSKK
jgi:hypothetical protein